MGAWAGSDQPRRAVVLLLRGRWGEAASLAVVGRSRDGRDAACVVATDLDGYRIVLRDSEKDAENEKTMTITVAAKTIPRC